MTHVHLPLTPEWILWPLPWVWALVALPLLPGLWLLWRRGAYRPAIRFSGIELLRPAGRTWRSRFRLLLPALRTLALACLIVAVARPQRPDESSRIFAEGIAIQMVVDTSSSMEQTDLSPRRERMTRLDVVKDVFRRFVFGDDELPGRPNDLVGMIRFALYPDSVCPLTLDHAALDEVLEQTDITRRREEDFTAIGDALALAVSRLKDLERTSGTGEQYEITSRVIILLTDGEQNAGEIQPDEAGELAALYGIKVYTILAGTGKARGWFRAPVDDRALREIAEETGGRFYQASDVESLEQVYAEIDQLERTKTEERRFVHYGELSQPLLVTAFTAVCLQVLLAATWLRKIP